MPRRLLAAEHRRALELLTDCPGGCTEALMMAHGFDGNVLACAIDRPRPDPAIEASCREDYWMSPSAFIASRTLGHAATRST